MLRFLTLTLMLSFSLVACKAREGDLCFTDKECGDGFMCCKKTISVKAEGSCKVMCTVVVPSDAASDTASQSDTSTDSQSNDTLSSDTTSSDTISADTTDDASASDTQNASDTSADVEADSSAQDATTSDTNA